MCMHFIKVKGVAPQSVRQAYAPCGKCEECLQMERSSWEFRYRAEVDELVYRHNWQLGFITLTYNDQNLPYLPPHVFKGYDPYTCSCPDFRPVPCFNKSDIRNLINSLRKWLNKVYGCRRLVYMVCSEFGSHTQRPHYHASFIFPPEVPAIDFYQAIRDLWCGESVVITQPMRMNGKERVIDLSKRRPNKGFVCPRQFDGYGREKPFLVSKSDATAAAKYIAKYVCKDMYFFEQLPLELLNKNKVGICENEEEEDDFADMQMAALPLLRDYLPFHFQTRSLGLSILSNKNDKQLLRLFKYGVNFVGDKDPEATPVPLYIKNKILFTPYYVVDSDGKRLVRRKASEFFNEHYKEVFRKKVDFYEKIFKDLCTSDYYKSHNLSAEKAEEWSNVAAELVTAYSDNPRDLAEDYVCYYGVPRLRCHAIDDKAMVYLNRYFPDDQLVPLFQFKGNHSVWGDYPILSESAYVNLKDVASVLLGLVWFATKKTKTEEDKLIDLVADYHKHLDESFFEECGYIKEGEDYVF